MDEGSNTTNIAANEIKITICAFSIYLYQSATHSPETTLSFGQIFIKKPYEKAPTIKARYHPIKGKGIAIIQRNVFKLCYTS